MVMHRKHRDTILIFNLLFVFLLGQAQAQNVPTEDDYYRITTVPVPEGIHLEGGGVLALPTGKLMVCTRRGDVWLIENPTMAGNQNPTFKKFASGLHEPLGIAQKNSAIYIAQRGELTKLTDVDGDEIADNYETIYAWPLTSHYHEYSFGPVIDENGDFFVTANVSFSNEEWWRGISRAPWRGWTMKITEDGQMQPWATGMRSPAGYGLYEGELFYTDNQGDWKGSGAVWHVPKGAFTGHPAGLAWTNHPDSPVSLTEEQFYAKIDKRQEKINGSYIKPENIENEEDPDFEFEAMDYFDELQLPAVILPHGLMGISNSEIVEESTNGKFGPFSGQLLVGDQGQSKVMRVGLEKINGEYQGFAIDFRSGFQSGVMRMDFDNNGNLFVGETNRGWGSAGTTNDGLEYVTWTGKTPFEIKSVSAKPDGFEITFTKPIEIDEAAYIDSYSGKSYVYKYHAVYGSPQTNVEELTPSGVKVDEDGLKLRLVYNTLRPFYVHEIKLDGIRSKEDDHPLLHPTFYYTLNQIPKGEKLDKADLSTKKKKKVVTSAKPKTTSKRKVSSNSSSKKITFAEVEPLLQKNTCIACHQSEKKVVGPSYKDIAQRRYSNERIVELIYNPEPKNWPEYATPMAPMPQVPRDEALKIAAWINTLRDY